MSINLLEKLKKKPIPQKESIIKITLNSKKNIFL